MFTARQQNLPYQRWGHLILSGMLGALFIQWFWGAGIPARAEDWPMWGRDAQRSASDPQQWLGDLPARCTHLQWMRQLPPPQPAWGAPLFDPRLMKNYFPDRSYEPVVMDGTMFVPSMLTDSLTALDAKTGSELWRFYADGPIRFAPAASQGRVYFGSDDGHVYCVDAAKGTLLWKFRGAPTNRMAIGHDRLVSAWPVRGAPVVIKDRVYFACGLWPTMGVFVHALDAATGQRVWLNDGASALLVDARGKIKFAPGRAVDDPVADVASHRPGIGPSLTGVLPHGYLAAAEVDGQDVLVVPSGMNPLPSVFDRRTGQLLYGGGNYFAAENSTTAFSGFQDKAYHRELEARFGKYLRPFYRQDLAGKVWRIDGTGKESRLSADPPAANQKSKPVPGEVASLLTAGDRLFAVTIEGGIYCFASAPGPAAVHNPLPAPVSPAAAMQSAAAEILNAVQPLETYCLVLGLEDGGLVEALLAATKQLHVIAVDPDEQKVDMLRRRLDAAGLYGRRAAIHAGDPLAFGFPPYMATLITSERFALQWLNVDNPLIDNLYQVLRPYGGALCLALSDDQHQTLASRISAARHPQADVRREGQYTLLRRVGELPGAGAWTHELFGNAANTGMSADSLIRAPLGIQWFSGGPGIGSKGNQPLVAGGRMIIREGPAIMDVYTGREISNAATGYRRPTIATESHAYSMLDNAIAQLDVCTGKTIRELKLPPGAGRPTQVMLADGRLIAAARNSVAAFNVSDGSLAWEQKTASELPALALKSGRTAAAGGKKVFCVYRMTEKELPALAGSPGADNGQYTVLMALGIVDGKPLWHSVLAGQRDNLLVYSEEHDILFRYMTAAPPVPRPKSEGLPYDSHLVAHRGSDGKVLWDMTDQRLAPPFALNGNQLISKFRDEATGEPFVWSIDALSGKEFERTDPLTGESIHWRLRKGQGCNFLTGSAHLLTYRSGTASYVDLLSCSGSGQFVDARTGCTNTIVAAEGVVVAPRARQGCVCQFGLDASVGFVHAPDAEMWTAFGAARGAGAVKRIGINLGAPGDRTTTDGTLWLDFPSVGYFSPDVPVEVRPDKTVYFQHHSSTIEEGPLPWVAASGAEGLEEIRITLAKPDSPPRLYTVRLHFAEERQDSMPGQRIFSLAIQGQEVLKQFDIVQAAGGPRRAIVKEFPGIPVTDVLSVRLTPAASSTLAPLLCGLELVADPP